MESNIVSKVNVNSGIVITPSSSGFVVNFTKENMSADQSSLVQKIIPRLSKIVGKTIGIR